MPAIPDREAGVHSWIRVEPPYFEANQIDCEIWVDTDRLLADRRYQRQLLLQTNADPATYSVVLQVKTAAAPAAPPYVLLGAVFAIAALLGTVLATTGMSTFLPLWLPFTLAGIVSLDTALNRVAAGEPGHHIGAFIGSLYGQLVGLVIIAGSIWAIGMFFLVRRGALPGVPDLPSVSFLFRVGAMSLVVAIAIAGLGAVWGAVYGSKKTFEWQSSRGCHWLFVILIVLGGWRLLSSTLEVLAIPLITVGIIVGIFLGLFLWVNKMAREQLKTAIDPQESIVILLLAATIGLTLSFWMTAITSPSASPHGSIVPDRGRSANPFQHQPPADSGYGLALGQANLETDPASHPISAV